MTKIVVSPGHTKDYPGVRKNGKVEHDIVNRLSDILVEDLKSQDVDVIKIDGILKDKVEVINKIKPLIAIELHLGNSNNNAVRGVRAFYKPSQVKSRKLASHLLDRCSSNLGLPKVGYYSGWYKKITPSMVNNGRAPADWTPKIDIFLAKLEDPIIPVLFEPFFISSQTDVESLSSDENLRSISKSIIDGIVDFIMNMDSYVDSSNSETKQ